MLCAEISASGVDAPPWIQTMTGRRVAFGRCIGEKTLTLQANRQLNQV